MADYLSDNDRQKFYKARRGKIHKYNQLKDKLECGRKLTWNYTPLHIAPQISDRNKHLYCQRCFVEDHRRNKILTDKLPDELFEI